MSKDRSSEGVPPVQDRQRIRAELGARLGLVLEEFTDRREAARIAGCSERALEEFVAGRRFPPFETLARIAGGTGISLDWLASGEEPMTRAWRSAAAPTPAVGAGRPSRPIPGQAAAATATAAGDTSRAIDPDLLAMVIRMILDALEDDRIDLYSFAMAELISLVYVAVAEADAKAASERTDVVEIARDNLRRLVPLVTTERPR